MDYKGGFLLNVLTEKRLNILTAKAFQNVDPGYVEGIEQATKHEQFQSIAYKALLEDAKDADPSKVCSELCLVIAC